MKYIFVDEAGKYERDNFSYYDMIKKYIKVEEVLTKDRNKCFY